MEELISKRAAIEAINSHFGFNIEEEYGSAVQEVINGLPSAEPERKKGEWINMGDFEQCSVCGETHLKEFQSYYTKTTWIKTNFCPNCGANMRGEQDDA